MCDQYEWDESGISFESNIHEISNIYRIKYLNSIRILNGVEMSCRDMASSRGRVRAGVVGIMAIIIDLSDPNLFCFVKFIHLSNASDFIL